MSEKCLHFHWRMRNGDKNDWACCECGERRITQGVNPEHLIYRAYSNSPDEMPVVIGPNGYPINVIPPSKRAKQEAS